MLLGGVLPPRAVARLTGRLPFREASLADVGARPRPLSSAPDGDGPARVLETGSVVLSGGGTVLDPGFRVVRDACSLSPRRDAPWDAARDVGLLPRDWTPSTDVRRVAGLVANLTAATQRYYFHWLLDVLPRVELVRRSGAVPDVWYADLSHPFQRETLAALGVPADRVVDAGRTPTVLADRALLPMHRIENDRPVPDWVVRFLRSALGPREASAPSRRLFVSRADATTRRLVDEDALAGRLRPLGFEVLRPADLPVAEQARLFAGAACVVAPHGSALANLVFASRGARVVELMPPRGIDLYRRLCDAVGCAHVEISGESVDGRPSLYADFRVSADEVVRRVEEMLA